MNSQENHDFILRISCVLASLMRKWKIIFLVMLVCGIGLDVFKTLTYHPLYSSSLTAVLKLEENTYSQLENAKGYIKTLDYIFNGQVVKNEIMKKLNTDDLNMTCHVTSVNETNVVNIQVLSSSRKNAYYSLKYITEWYQKNTDRYQFTYDLDILEKATLNEMPINSNNHFETFKKGVMISGGLVIAILSLFAYLKDTIKTPRDIENKLDCRLFAKIPFEKKPNTKKFWKKKKQAILVSSLKTSFFYKESIKKLRGRLESSAKKHGYKTILVTSSFENEGKSSVSANLALSLAQNKHKVLLIDADIRKPSLHKIFELTSKKCLNHYLSGQSPWESQVEYIQKQDLFVMCAMQDLNRAEEYAQGQRMKALIEAAREEFDFVIIDSSPAYDINEPIILNEMVDASLLVVKQDVALASFINETIYRLVNVKNNLIGCVYNASFIDVAKAQKTYGYRYGYNRYQREERGQ